jgi:hypothetical protein
LQPKAPQNIKKVLRKSKNTNGNNSCHLSLSNALIKEWYDAWYKEDKKIVPQKLVKSIFNKTS